MSTIKIKAPAMPEPDTHCFDDDTQKDVWSHSADQLAARDAQWQAKYGPVVEALADVMFRHVPFTNKQDYAERARAALSAITEE